jgi:hypothetical protein
MSNVEVLYLLAACSLQLIACTKSILIKGGQESTALAMEKIATYPAPGQCGQKELKGEFSYAHLRVLISFYKAGCKRIKGLKKVSLIRC